MNSIKTISTRQAFKFAISQYRAHFGEFMKLLFFTIALISAVFLRAWLINGSQLLQVDSTRLFFPDAKFPLSMLLNAEILFCLIAHVHFFFEYQVTRLSFLIFEQQENRWEGFFSLGGAARFFKFFIAILWLKLRLILGLVFLIIPGIYLYVKYFFTSFFLIEGKTHSISQDVGLNRELTRGVLWELLPFALVYFTSHLLTAVLTLLLLKLTGMPPLVSKLLAIIPELVLMPLLILAAVHLFKQLERCMVAPQTEQE